MRSKLSMKFKSIYWYFDQRFIDVINGVHRKCKTAILIPFSHEDQIFTIKHILHLRIPSYRDFRRGMKKRMKSQCRINFLMAVFAEV